MRGIGREEACEASCWGGRVRVRRGMECFRNASLLLPPHRHA